MPYCTVLYCTVLYCTVLYCTVLYCTVLHCCYMATSIVSSMQFSNRCMQSNAQSALCLLMSLCSRSIVHDTNVQDEMDKGRERVHVL